MRINGRLTLALLIVAFAPLIEGGTTHPPVFILRILVIALLAAHLAAGVGQGSIEFFRTPLDLAVIAFLAAAALSTVIAPYKYTALTWVQLIIHYALFFYLARAALARDGAAGYALVAVLAISVFEGGLAVFQWLGGTWRPSGTFFNPNMLAGYVAPAALMSGSLLIFRHRWSRGAARAVALSAVCLLGVAVALLTGSRGGVFALSAGLFVVLWARRRAWALAATAVVLLAVLLVPNPVRERIFSEEPFAYSRAGIWTGAARMMADHPLGVGLGNFKYYWPRYNFPVEGAIVRYGKSANTAHGEYLQVGAEMGFPGLAVFIFGIGFLARALYRYARLPGKDEDRPLLIGISGGITAALTHSLVDANLHEPGIVFLLILLAALAFSLDGGERENKNVLIKEKQKARLVLLMSGLLFLMVAWAALPALGYYYSDQCMKAMKRGDPASALVYAEKASAVEPGNASYHDQAAAARYALYARYGTTDDLQASLTELSDAGRLNPVDRAYPAREAYMEYAYAAGLKDPAGQRAWLGLALKSSRRARELDPYGWDILMTQARVEMGLGDAAGAVATLGTLVKLEPDFLMGRLLLARALKDSGKTKDALAQCYDIIKISERLSKERLDEHDRRFTAVNMGDVRELTKSLEAG